MTQAQTAVPPSTKPGPRPGQMVQEKDAVKQIPEARMTPAAFVHGDLLHITLPDDERVEEGVQDIQRWMSLGPKLGMHQWLEIVNDSGSMWRLMRVERIHGGPGSGLRALTLRDIVPPSFADLSVEEIISTGEWRIQHGGAHRRWMVITPTGVVKFEGINTEGEAKTICSQESRNPKPR